MDKKSAYHLDHSALIEAFRKAVADYEYARLSRQARGLITATVEELSRKDDDVQYFYGILLSRLEGVTPPMDTGDTVRFVLAKEGAPNRTLKRIYYINHSWKLTLESDTSTVHYHAEELEPAPSAGTYASA